MEKNLLRLNAAVTRPDGLINLAEAALLFAQSEYPELRVDTYLSRLDEMAAVVKKRLIPGASLASVIFKLNRFLFEEQGFAANIDEYYDPRNSFLNEVLERKTGIPISLSMIYIEIGQRIGLPLTGVLFPGHFLVKLSIEGGDIVLDPFAGGRSLSEQDLLSHLSNLMDFHPSDPIDLTRLLAPARKRDVLSRMLRNLKAIYVKSEEYLKALNVIQHMLVVNPNDLQELRDRGYIYDKLECYKAASEDYKRYLSLAPDGPDLQYLRERLLEVEKAKRRLH
ncbi:MAG: SirB1 family protein [Gammaproteobacteria bacterium]